MNVADRVKETTSSTSDTTIVLTGAAPGFRRFIAGFSVGDTDIPCGVEYDASTWVSAAYTLTDANTLTLTKRYDSSNGGAAVTFPNGPKTVTCAPCAGWFEDFAQISEGITVQELPRGIPQSADLIPFARASGGDLTIAYSDFVALISGNPPASDTTAPSFPDSLSSSNVTQTSFTLSWQAATDASGIARYEYSYDGSTWTTAGTSLSINLTGRTAGTTYTMRVRAVDPSGNTSTVRTLSVTTAVASGDTQAPSMSGSISTSNITSSGYTFSWTAGTDNVGIDHYETSIDGGTSWLGVGTSLSRTVTGRPVATTDNLRVRAHDAAGNISNVLSGTVTTLATVPAAPTIGTAVAGDGYVDVAFTRNGNGGSAVLDSTATLSTGQTATGTSSPIRVSAPNGTAVTATVEDRNSIGLSSPSAPSNSVTPQAAAQVPQYTVRTTQPNGTAISGTIFPAGSAPFQGTAVDRYASGSGLRVQVLDANGNAPDDIKIVWGTSPTVPPAGVTFDSTALPIGATDNDEVRPTGIAAGSHYQGWTQENRGSYYGVFTSSGSLFAWQAASRMTDHLRYPWIFPNTGGAFVLDNGAGPVGRQVTVA